MMHSSPDIVKNSAGFFCARVTAAVFGVKERNGGLDHVALSSVPHWDSIHLAMNDPSLLDQTGRQGLCQKGLFNLLS